MTRRRDVRETYDRIGAHFAATRPEPWSEVEAFLRGRSGDVGLDVGVGNGRHAELLAARTDRVVGLDASRTVLGTARERARDGGFALERVQGDASALPLRDDVVDLGVYVATIHHLPTRALRIASLDELARVLRPGGAAIVSTWCTAHERFDREAGFDTTVDWTLPDGERVPRFYHVYDLEEFGADVAASALGAVDLFESSGNGYAVVEG